MPITIYTHTLLYLRVVFVHPLLTFQHFSSVPALHMHSAFGDATQMCTFEGGISFV